MTPAIVRRYAPSRVIAGGMFVSAVGFVILSQAGGASSTLATLVAGQIVFSLGLTPVAALTTDIILSSAPPERAGAASALSETSAELGGALGIALMGSIVTAVYRGGFNGAVAEGIPADALEAARTTIGAAVTAAGDLEGEHGYRAPRDFAPGIRRCVRRCGVDQRADRDCGRIARDADSAGQGCGVMIPKEAFLSRRFRET